MSGNLQKLSRNLQKCAPFEQKYVKYIALFYINILLG